VLEGDTVDALILGFVIDVVEVSENLDRGDMASCVINDAFRPIFHEKFEEHESLYISFISPQDRDFVYLSPFLGRFICESLLSDDA
jgi:hypothetical protein